MGLDEQPRIVKMVSSRFNKTPGVKRIRNLKSGGQGSECGKGGYGRSWKRKLNMINIYGQILKELTKIFKIKVEGD